MAEAKLSKEVMSELKSIKKEVDFIKKHMVNIDSIMTEDDYAALQDYRKEKKAGKLTSHEQLKKELEL